MELVIFSTALVLLLQMGSAQYCVPSSCPGQKSPTVSLSTGLSVNYQQRQPLQVTDSTHQENIAIIINTLFVRLFETKLCVFTSDHVLKQ